MVENTLNKNTKEIILLEEKKSNLKQKLILLTLQKEVFINKKFSLQKICDFIDSELNKINREINVIDRELKDK